MTGGRDPLKVLVAGAGGIGQFIGARLQQGGHMVTLLARPVHAEAIRADGLRVGGLSQMHGHLDCITDASAGDGPFDAILLTTKAHATAQVARQVAPLLARDGVFVSVQNGFGNGQKIAGTAPLQSIVVAITSHGVMMHEPGLLEHTGTGPTDLGAFSVEGASSADRAQSLLADAGLEPAKHGDIRPFVWRKALVNHAVNPLAALHSVPNGRLLEAPTWPKCVELAEEGYAIARAAGVPLAGIAGSAGLVEVVRATLERTRANRNSMLQDVTAKKPTEIEQISGRLVRLARRLGHPAFASEETYHHLKDLEAAYLGGAESMRMTREEAAWESAPF